MRNLSITEAKKELSHLAQSEQTFRLTNRGQEVSTFRVFVQPKFEPVKAKEAFEKLKAIRSAQPSKTQGATASVRRLRNAS